MKKTLIVIAIAAVLVFALAAPAFAVNASDQQRLGAGAAAPAHVDNLVSGQTNPVDGAGTWTYQDWNTATSGNNVPSAGNSPHGNYATSTVKCVVCHAIHYAAPGGAPVSAQWAANAADVRIGTQSADTLLRMRAENACIYCHATANQAVNGRPVYNGQGNLISSPEDATIGHRVGTNCNTCHASVHGVGSDETVQALKGYLLLKITNNDAPLGATTSDMISNITAIDNNAFSQGFARGAALNGTIAAYAGTNSTELREQAVGVFCAECHNGSYAAAAPGAAANVRGAAATAYSGHRINVQANGNWNATGNISSGSVRNKVIAWAAAEDCKGCHDAKDDTGGTAFPHAWGGSTSKAKMWLTQSDKAGGASITSMTDGDQLKDGVCLKCHVSSDGLSGVGQSF